jgi:hypothetical protein
MNPCYFPLNREVKQKRSMDNSVGTLKVDLAEESP